MIKRIKSSDLMRNVLVLMTGTVFAQVFSYALSPLISRLYNESDMADFGLYSRLVAFISSLISARLELSLPVPKSNFHAYLIYRLSVNLVLVSILISLFFGFIYLMNVSYDLDLIYLIILSIFSSLFVAFINLGTNWSIRTKNFKKISQQRITNSLSSNLLKVGLGYFHFGSLGLLLSTFLGYLLSSIHFLNDFFKSKYYKIKSSTKTKVLLKEYKEFPLIVLPHTLLDMGRDLFVAFIVVYHFGKDIFGSYVYSTMMLSLPIAVIGQSVGQVFFNKCAEMINQGKSIIRLLYQSFSILFLLSVIPFGLIYFYGEEIFTIVFGKVWSHAGKFSEIMALWMALNFVISPLSNLPLLLKRQKENFYIGLLDIAVQVFCFGVLPFFIDLTNLLQGFIYIMWVYTMLKVVVLFITAYSYVYFAKYSKTILL
jgi:O-antigen/teichoic acid export membrane protein